MRLKNFINNFVGHNSAIALFDAKVDMMNKIKSLENKERDYKLELLWYGMEWQASGSNEEDYYKTHLDVAPCPYLNSDVVRVFPYEDDVTSILGIEINVDWEDYEQQIKNRENFMLIHNTHLLGEYEVNHERINISLKDS